MPSRLHVARGGRLDVPVRQKLVVERGDGPPGLVPSVEVPKLHAENCGLQRVETPVESDLDVLVLSLPPVIAKDTKPVTDL